MANLKPGEYPTIQSSHEARRLDAQHEVITKAAGYLLHPTITSALQTRFGNEASNTASDGQSQTLLIADIATGSAAFLLALSEPGSLPPSTQLVGFDVSDAQFPAKETLPKNISLSIHDAKMPFESSDHQKYDAVHLRFLTGGLSVEDWAVVARNVFDLVRKGGWVTWVEGDFGQMVHSLRGGQPGAEAKVLDTLFTRHGAEQVRRTAESAAVGCRGLPGILEEVGFEHVETDVFSSDRCAEDRGKLTRGLVDVTCAAMRMGLEKAGVGEDMLRREDELRERMLGEVDDGTYLRFDCYVHVARRPK